MSDAAPATIGPYHVERELGRGGMGVVYEVTDPDTPRALALKLLLDRGLDPTANERFWREANVLAKVQHRNVVRVHQVGHLREGTYLLLELAKHAIDAGVRLPPAITSPPA